MTRGTREWAEKNFNLFSGCMNDCRYCYAKDMAIRYGRKTPKDWHIMAPLKHIVYPKDSLVMFPSTHDLFYWYIDEIEEAVEKLLDRGNMLLIVTKPSPRVIKDLVDFFGIYYGSTVSGRVEFRFTIGSDDNEALKFWEPFAPSLKERLEAIKILDDFNDEDDKFRLRYSISMEPLLTLNPENLIRMIPNAKEFWLGKMNHFDLGSPKGYDERKYFRKQKKINSPNFWKVLYLRFKDLGVLDRIRWKDSVISYVNGIKYNKQLEVRK